MNLIEYRVSDVMKLTRRPVEITPGETYYEIGVRSFGKGIFHKQPSTAEEIGSKKVFHIKPGDLVFSNIFAWEGGVALASEQESGKIGSHRFMTYIVNEDLADPRYLLRYFYGGPGVQTIHAASPGSAGRNRTLGIKKFEQQRIQLPGVQEQRRVADKLDGAMQKISRLIILRDRSRQIVHNFYNAVFGSISELASLSQALRQSYDFVEVHPDESYATAGILNRGRGLFRRPVISGTETKYARYNRLHSGQFVYSKLFGWEGSLAVVPDAFEGVHVSHEFPTFDIDSTAADVEYMSHLARWTGLHDSLKDQGTGMGSRRQRVNVDRLLATQVPMPSELAEQRRIARQMTLAHRAMEAGAAQVEQTEVLRKALLNAAFSGQL